MRIAIVSQYYAPEAIRIPDSLATSLAARGHEVRVITGFPNYPSGTLFDGYTMRLRSVDHVAGVSVRRVPLYISHSYNPVARLINYGTFALSSALAGHWVRNADVVYVYATQMTPAVGPSIWRWLFGTPFVLHIQDLWPESITGSSMVGNSIAKRAISVALRPWLGFLYRTAAATVAIAPTMAAMLVDRGVPPERITTVYNWATSEPADDMQAATNSNNSSTVVVYAGNFGDHQDLPTVLRAAKLVSDVPGLTIRLVGSGVAEPALRALAADLSLKNVEFVGRVPPEQMAEIHRDSDFQLVTLRDLDIFRGTIPSKLQAALSAGKPVISAVAGDVRTIVEANDVGFACEPGDPEQLAAALRAAASMSHARRRELCERARSFYRTTMDRDIAVERIEQILHSVSRSTKRGAW